MSVSECKSSGGPSAGGGGGPSAGGGANVGGGTNAGGTASKGADGAKDGAKAAQAGASGAAGAGASTGAKAGTESVGAEAKTSAESVSAKSEISKEMAEEKEANLKSEAARVAAGEVAKDTVHTVQKGETLSGIAKASEVTLKSVVNANPQIKNPDLIHPGDQVNVPGAKAADPAAAAKAKTDLGVYPPGSAEQVSLFEKAADIAGVPKSWASSDALQHLLAAESAGKVGVPNYTYGDRVKDPAEWSKIHEELRNGKITAKSSATGLGQLLARNVDKYYPSGRQGIGDPVEEAAGMMGYIKDRYGTPERAWSQYNKHGEGY